MRKVKVDEYKVNAVQNFQDDLWKSRDVFRDNRCIIYARQ